MMNKPIAIIVRQIGSARLISSIIDSLIKAGFSPFLFAASHAADYWKKEGYNFFQYTNFYDVVNILEEINPLVVFSGTSDNVADDGLFWKWAQEHNIPSIGFVDTWVNYWQRFTLKPDSGKHYNLLPDYVAVIDKIMADSMIEEGCPQEKIVITGSPLYDKINNFLDNNRNMQSNYNKGQILFVGDPFNPIMGEDEKKTLGFTEIEVFELTIKNIIQLNKEYNQQYSIIYKPHPRGFISKQIHEIIDYYKNKIEIFISKADTNSWKLVYQSRLVVGLYSVLLYEAMLLGSQVLSIQPNKKIRIDNIDRRDGIFLVTKESDILPILKRLIKQQRKMKVRKQNLNSISNFIDLFHRVINLQESL